MGVLFVVALTLPFSVENAGLALAVAVVAVTLLIARVGRALKREANAAAHAVSRVSMPLSACQFSTAHALVPEIGSPLTSTSDWRPIDAYDMARCDDEWSAAGRSYDAISFDNRSVMSCRSNSGDSNLSLESIILGDTPIGTPQPSTNDLRALRGGDGGNAASLQSGSPPNVDIVAPPRAARSVHASPFGDAPGGAPSMSFTERLLGGLAPAEYDISWGAGGGVGQRDDDEGGGLSESGARFDLDLEIRGVALGRSASSKARAATGFARTPSVASSSSGGAGGGIAAAHLQGAQSGGVSGAADRLYRAQREMTFGEIVAALRAPRPTDAQHGPQPCSLCAGLVLGAHLLDALCAFGALAAFASAALGVLDAYAVAPHNAPSANSSSGTVDAPRFALGPLDSALHFMYRYISRESCSQFDSLPLTSLTISGPACSALVVALAVALLAAGEEGAALLVAQCDEQCSAQRGAAGAGGQEQRAPCGATLARGTEALALAARVAVVLLMACGATYVGLADEWGDVGEGGAVGRNGTRALAARARESTLWARPSGATAVMANVLFALATVSALARGRRVVDRAPRARARCDACGTVALWCAALATLAFAMLATLVFGGRDGSGVEALVASNFQPSNFEHFADETAVAAMVLERVVAWSPLLLLLQYGAAARALHNSTRSFVAALAAHALGGSHCCTTALTPPARPGKLAELSADGGAARVVLGGGGGGDEARQRAPAAPPSHTLPPVAEHASAGEEVDAERGGSLYGDHFRSPSLATLARIDANLADVAAAGRVRVATRLRASAARAAQRAALGEACVRVVFLACALLSPVALCYALGGVAQGALLTQRLIGVFGGGVGVAWAVTAPAIVALKARRRLRSDAVLARVGNPFAAAGGCAAPWLFIALGALLHGACIATAVLTSTHEFPLAPIALHDA